MKRSLLATGFGFCAVIVVGVLWYSLRDIGDGDGDWDGDQMLVVSPNPEVFRDDATRGMQVPAPRRRLAASATVTEAIDAETVYVLSAEEAARELKTLQELVQASLRDLKDSEDEGVREPGTKEYTERLRLWELYLGFDDHRCSGWRRDEASRDGYPDS